MSDDRVTRALILGWSNKRLGVRWTRRARWFEWRGDEGVSIRLCFEERDLNTEERVVVNSFYDNEDAAGIALEHFVDGVSAREFRA
jgi:hypothetical protein